MSRAELPVAEFFEYLRRGEVPEPYLSVYQAEAEAFVAAFEDRSIAALGPAEVERYLEIHRRAGATERHLRNLAVVCEALLSFLSAPAAPRLPPQSPAEHRRHRRIPFLKEVEVLGVGVRRSSDLSLGGIYLETVTAFHDAEVLGVRFKLRDDDPLPVQVKARVAYQHEGLGVGLSFVDLSPADHARIEQLIDRW
ncbi:MAG TPA: PilZ domain-containing protein [Myxococcota bacterium]|jgi:hypothetical protein|nr:PilZ domain-containing protein [Myxococcota bacterium]